VHHALGKCYVLLLQNHFGVTITQQNGYALNVGRASSNDVIVRGGKMD